MAIGDRYKVWVELNPESRLPIRILTSRFDMSGLPRDRVEFVSKKFATDVIRRQVFERDGNECQRCAKVLSAGTGHMDHRVAKSEGGETSVSNCWRLCADCHVWSQTSEHGDRIPKFSRRKL